MEKAGNIVVVGGQRSVQSVIGVRCNQYCWRYCSNDRGVIKNTLSCSELYNVAGLSLCLGHAVGIRSRGMVIYKELVKVFDTAPRGGTIRG